MLDKVFKNLNANIESDYLVEAYNKAINDSDEFYLTTDFVNKLNDYYDVIPRNYNALLLTAEKLKDNSDLKIFVKILYHLIGYKKSFTETFKVLTLPTLCGKEDISYDCAHALAVLGHVPNYFNELSNRGVDFSVARDTVRLFDINMESDSKIAGKPYLSLENFSYYKAYVYTNTLWIERLRFEISNGANYPIVVFKNKVDSQIKIAINGTKIDQNGYVLGAKGVVEEDCLINATVVENGDFYEGYFLKEDSTFSTKTEKILKNEWEIIFKPSDQILKVHVPYVGEFTPEIIKKSFEKAYTTFKNCYKEYDFKGFLICTWFMSRGLDGIVKENSNISAFRNCFKKFPMATNGTSIFEYVFNLNVSSVNEIDYNSLVEDNSLRRGIKQKAKNGVIFHEFGGYRLFE